MLRVLFYAGSQHFDIIVFHMSNQITSGFSLLDYEIMRNCVSLRLRQRQTDDIFWYFAKTKAKWKRKRGER